MDEVSSKGGTINPEMVSDGLLHMLYFRNNKMIEESLFCLIF